MHFNIQDIVLGTKTLEFYGKGATKRQQLELFTFNGQLMISRL
jgi:hypothetical protein